MRIDPAARRKRTSIGVALAAVLAATLLPLTSVRAQAGPNIEFVNPSGYTSSLNISDKSDADGAVHLVAWVGPVPANPFVEFEISSATATTTLDGERGSNDTWEVDLQVASLTDGQYTLRARLFKDFSPGTTATEVDVVERTVTLNRSEIPPPSPSNTVEMTYPNNGGPFGVHMPKGKRANGLIDVIASEGTRQVRALYSTTAPGNPPTWTDCGSAAVATDRTARVRCTLAEEATASQVTAVAVVANDTPPPAGANPVADATGDAHRVLSYAQLVKNIDINPESIIGDPDSCVTFTATATDQSNRPVAAANLDVHAVGPDDQLRFGNVTDVTSEFQAPDKAHVAGPRAAINCANKANQGTQGDHNIPGADDPQHIESVAGTSNVGQFVFALHSLPTGGTRIDVWSDGEDDDVQQPAETSVGARLGWGEPPPQAEREIFLEPVRSTAEAGACQRIEMLGKLSGSPMAGQNVDVHITGPDETVSYCLPPDASSGTAPNGGTHTGNADDATTRHLEGVLDGNGRFVFGVTSATEGTTSIVTWADTLEDDIKGTDEASGIGDVGWTLSGDRSISIQSNKSTARKGSRVRISGSIDGSTACESDQVVKLKAKRLNRGRFRTISSTTTDSDGSYLFTPIIRISKKYRTVAPVAGACEKASSRVITIRTN
jgi:hypothetical protein